MSKHYKTIFLPSYIQQILKEVGDDSYIIDENDLKLYLLNHMQKNYKGELKVESNLSKNGYFLATENNPFDVFIPDVWTSLDLTKKMIACKLVFEYLVKRNTSLMLNKPRLKFTFNKINYNGKTSIVSNKQILKLNIDFLNQAYSIKILDTIFHEFCHLKQNCIYLKNIKNRKANKNFNDYEKSTFYAGSSYFFKILRYLSPYYSRELTTNFFRKNKKKLNLSFNNLIDFNSLAFHENDTTLNYILELLYLCYPIEITARQHARNCTKKIKNYFAKNYGISNFKKIPDSLKLTLEDLKEEGYKFTKEDLNNFGKINIMLNHSNSLIVKLNCVAYIYQTYLDKKVPKDFPECDEDLFRNAQDEAIEFL